MVNKITDIKIIREFENDSSVYGFYTCNFNGTPELLTRNGDKINVLSHCSDHDELFAIRDDVKAEFLKELKGGNVMYESKEEKAKILAEALKPVLDYLYEYGDPYTTIIISQADTEVVQNEMYLENELRG